MSDKTIRLAIAGIGNCASSLVQGIEYYKNADPTERVPGLMHVELGGYHVGDIEVVAAFDVDAEKVGLDVAKAIAAGQNNTITFCDVPDLGITVQRGPTLDGFGEFYRQVAEESPAEPIDIAQALRDTRADVLVSYLPVGSEHAQKHYATACLEAGVAFVNAIPVFIASDPEWAAKFEAAGVPIVGDDIKSQVGATIVHRTLARLFEDRGTTIDHTYQLNFGGNMDFMNMLERSRLKSKKISKTQSVTSQIDAGISDHDVHIGPSDHVPWLDDRKWALIRLEGRNFGDVPLTVELKLEVHDSPNSAGVIIDAVRCAKVALDRGVGGPVLPACQYFMKSPPVQVHDEVARDALEAFILGRVTGADGSQPAAVTARSFTASPGADLSLDVVHYGPDIPTEADFRLLGPVTGKRVLELGCGGGSSAVALAKQGARVIAIDESTEQVGHARRLADREEVKVELHQGDLAELAFVRADTIDVALSVYTLGTVADLDRVFRQVHRVMRPEAPFVISLPHPVFRTVDPSGDPPAVQRSYFDRAPISWSIDGEQGNDYPVTVAELFTSLTRANFRVDTLLEPQPQRRAAMSWVPSTLIVRARKHGT